MQLNDLIAYVAIIFLVLAIAGIAFLVTMDGLVRKLAPSALISGFKKGRREEPSKPPAKVTAAELIERGDAYVKKGPLLTEAEKILFKVLQSKWGQTHHVFCQVRVVDVIQPNTSLYKERSREWMALFRQVSQWHFDFVICDRETMEVVRVIELDDASHKRKDRARRDGVMNRICNETSVDIERMELRVLQTMTKKTQSAA